MRPWTSYPFPSKNSARYDPSWPVTPVMSALFIGNVMVLTEERGSREARRDPSCGEPIQGRGLGAQRLVDLTDPLVLFSIGLGVGAGVENPIRKLVPVDQTSETMLVELR